MNLKNLFMSIIVASLVGFVSYFSGEVFYGSNPIKEHSYVVTGDGETASNDVLKIEQIKSYLETANLKKGKKLFRKCLACHTAKSGGKNKTGPNLFAVIGSKKGSKDFKYSNAMKSKGGTWSVQELSEFLTKPKAYVAGTKMNFAGFKKVEYRASIIAYLKTFQ